MNITVNHVAAGVALFVVAFVLGKQKAAAAAGTGAPTEANRISSSNQWWSYAGSWQQ